MAWQSKEIIPAQDRVCGAREHLRLLLAGLSDGLPTARVEDRGGVVQPELHLLQLLLVGRQLADLPAPGRLGPELLQLAGMIRVACRLRRAVHMAQG